MSKIWGLHFSWKKPPEAAYPGAHGFFVRQNPGWPAWHGFLAKTNLGKTSTLPKHGFGPDWGLYGSKLSFDRLPEQEIPSRS